MSLNNLFKILSEKNISPKVMSDNTGISTGNISDWKSGRSMPTAKKLIVMADYLNCSIDFLLDRTNNPKVNTSTNKSDNINRKKSKIIPLYMIGASAGTGNWLSDDVPVEYMTIPQNDKTDKADYMLRVSGNSMEPRFYDEEILLIKKSPSITEGEIGIFIVNNESFVKKMGRGELISLNPAYNNIKLNEYDDILCAGIVIDTINLDNYT